MKCTTPQELAEQLELGVNILMPTDDNPRNAEGVVKKLAMPDFKAGVTPHDRHEKVKKLRAVGRIVERVGDLINETPALDVADLGVVMGTGTDLAIGRASIPGAAIRLRPVSVIGNAHQLRSPKQ